jgi:hypothetical protein
MARWDWNWRAWTFCFRVGTGGTAGWVVAKQPVQSTILVYFAVPAESLWRSQWYWFSGTESVLVQ